MMCQNIFNVTNYNGFIIVKKVNSHTPTLFQSKIQVHHNSQRIQNP